MTPVRPARHANNHGTSKEGRPSKGRGLRDPAVLPGLRRQGVEGPRAQAEPAEAAGIAEARCRTDPARGPISRQAGGSPQGARVWFVAADGRPFAVNGVPIKRVNAAYVIATSTTVDLSSVPIPAKLLDGALRASARPQHRREGRQLLQRGQAGAAGETSDERKKDQKAIDDKLLKVIEKTPMLKHAHYHSIALFRLTRAADAK